MLSTIKNNEVTFEVSADQDGIVLFKISGTMYREATRHMLQAQLWLLHLRTDKRVIFDLESLLSLATPVIADFMAFYNARQSGSVAMIVGGAPRQYFEMIKIMGFFKVAPSMEEARTFLLQAA